MDEKTALEDAKTKIVAEHGPWTAHNIWLPHAVPTLCARVTTDELRAQRMVQIVGDVCRTDFRDLRILDLACLEGLYSVELARRGARVTGVEGREDNVVKARFAQQALGLDNLEFVRDDVRNVSLEKYGVFDVVLCLGILYHLDAPDVFQFAESLSRCCQRLLILDTHLSLSRPVRLIHKGRKYAGRYYQEHDRGSTPEDRVGRHWASLDNVRSFWLTRPSLYNLLRDAGFGSIYECHAPYLPALRDRVTLVALPPWDAASTAPAIGDLRSPERRERAVEPSQRWSSRIRSRAEPVLEMLRRSRLVRPTRSTPRNEA